MNPPSAVSAEDERERLARLEASRDEHREQIRQILPLVSQYAVLEERLRNFGDDLSGGFTAIRAELAEMKTAQAEQAKQRRTMLIALFVAGVGLFGTFVATAVPLLKGTPPIIQERTK